jgi:hypothetical protein
MSKLNLNTVEIVDFPRIITKRNDGYISLENDKKIFSNIEIKSFIINLKENSIINGIDVTSDRLSEFFSNEINNFCTSHIIFRNSKIKNLKIVNISIRSITFENCQIDELVIENNIIDESDESIIIDGGKIENFNINKSEIKNNLHINHNSQNKLEIVNLNISSSIFEKDFSFYNVIIKNAEIKDCDFNSLSEFIDSKFSDKFNFNEITYKGFTLFDNCTFNTKAEFGYIIFEKVTSFRNSIFNKGINLEYTSNDKDVNFYGVKGLDSKISKQNTSQETYRIIKNQFEKLNNKIEANKYHALEMEQHRKSVWKNIFKCNSFFESLSDGIISLVHWISSNHSSSWIRALVWIFVVSLITSWSLDSITVDNFFKYINILSKIEDFKDSYIAMTLNKVSLGYLYYQFLTAVRKDTRK